MKKQWGGLLTFVMIAVLSLPALGQQQAPAQAPPDTSAPAASASGGTGGGTFDAATAAESFHDGAAVNGSTAAHV